MSVMIVVHSRRMNVAYVEVKDRLQDFVIALDQ